MHRLLVTTLAFFLSSCSAEVASTAAVSGAAKAQEARQAQQNIERIQKQLDATAQSAQQQTTEVEKAMGY